MENLPQLRDIHLPDKSWEIYSYLDFLLVLLLVLLAYFFVKMLIKFRQASKKLYALHLLNRANLQDFKQSVCLMSEILRRICVLKYKEAGALVGKQWLSFLDSHSSQKLDDRLKELLINAPYMKCVSDTYTLSDVKQLQNYCKHWIGENL